jgi:hypothetical protein
MNFYMHLSFVWWSLHFNGLDISFLQLLGGCLIRNDTNFTSCYSDLSVILMWFFCYFHLLEKLPIQCCIIFCFIEIQNSEILLSTALPGQTEKFWMIFLIFSRQLPELYERALSVILCTSDYIISTLNLEDIQVFKQHMNDSPFLRFYGVT